MANSGIKNIEEYLTRMEGKEMKLSERQADCVSEAINGKNILATMQTGTCFVSASR